MNIDEVAGYDLVNLYDRSYPLKNFYLSPVTNYILLCCIMKLNYTTEAEYHIWFFNSQIGTCDCIIFSLMLVKLSFSFNDEFWKRVHLLPFSVFVRRYTYFNFRVLAIERKRWKRSIFQISSRKNQNNVLCETLSAYIHVLTLFLESLVSCFIISSSISCTSISLRGSCCQKCN